MKSKTTHHLSCLCLLLLLPPFTLAAQNITQTHSKLSALLADIKSLKAELLHTKTSQDKTHEDLRQTDLAVANSANDLAKTQKQLREQKKQLILLQKRQAALEKTFKKQQALFSEQLRQAYQFRQQDPLLMMLNQTDIQTMDRMMAYYRYFNATRLKQMQQIKTMLTELYDNEQTITQKTHSLKALEAKQRQQQRALLAQRQKQVALLHAMDQQLHSKQAQLKKLEADKQALTHLLDHLQQQHQRQYQAQFFLRQKGNLPAPTQGHIILHFNDAVSAQTDLPLHGILISAPTGQAVKAVAPGKVVFANWLRGMGFLIIIDHGKGYMSLYGHNQTLQVQTNDRIKQGQTIAYVGQSGGAKTPALYFAIRHNGTALDPLHWIKMKNT